MASTWVKVNLHREFNFPVGSKISSFAAYNSKSILDKFIGLNFFLGATHFLPPIEVLPSSSGHGERYLVVFLFNKSFY